MEPDCFIELLVEFNLVTAYSFDQSDEDLFGTLNAVFLLQKVQYALGRIRIGLHTSVKCCLNLN